MPIGHSSFDGHRPRSRVELYDLVHLLQGDKLLCAVRNLIETVACTQNLQVLLALHKLTNLPERFGGIQILRAIFKIPGPVFQLIGRRPSEQRRQSGAGHRGRPKFDEGAFVHGGNHQRPSR